MKAKAQALAANAKRRPMDEGAEMLARHIDGDPRAFEELVGRFGPKVYGFLTRSGIQAATKDDLFQETFMRVHVSARRYDPRYPFRVWLFAIANNVLRSHYRKKKVRRIFKSWWTRPARNDPHAECRQMDPPDERHDTHEKAAGREDVRWLESALSEIPEGQRRALLLTQVEGLSLKEAARILDAPVPTIKTWIRRGRLGLARAYAQKESES
jgi:RNA polymerase sigma-70 factor (ECF subfamily)